MIAALAILGLAIFLFIKEIQTFAAEYKLELNKDLETFSEILSARMAGISEIVIRLGSTVIGKSVVDMCMRKNLGISILAVNRGDEVIRTGLPSAHRQLRANPADHRQRDNAGLA